MDRFEMSYSGPSSDQFDKAIKSLTERIEYLECALVAAKIKPDDDAVKSVMADVKAKREKDARLLRRKNIRWYLQNMNEWQAVMHRGDRAKKKMIRRERAAMAEAKASEVG